MSYTFNGIGTQIHGQQRLLTRRGTCEICKKTADLQSYDATNYFVIAFLPILPLGKLRLLDHCSACQRWKQLKLKDWEEKKQTALSEVLAKLKQDPRNPAAVMEALSTSASFQDEAILLQFKQLAMDLTDDPEVQSTLAATLAYFSRHEEAIEALQHALRADAANDEYRERMAIEYLRVGDPAHADKCLTHLWNGTAQSPATIGQLLVEGFQVLGEHDAAMTRLERLTQAYPQLADDREFQKFCTQAAKLQRKQKPLQSTTLVSKTPKGFKDSGDKQTFVKYLAPALLVLGLTAWCGISAWKGLRQDVFLVNGLNHAYTATVNGEALELGPHDIRRISLTEGDVVFSVDSDHFTAPEQTVRVKTPFMSRPFGNRTFVLNPDQLALFSIEEVIYSEDGENPYEPAYAIQGAKALHEFRGINYVFCEEPDEIMMDGSYESRDVLATIDTRQRSDASILGELLEYADAETTRRYLLRRLERETASAVLVEGLRHTMSAEEYLELVKSHLDEEPVSVEWHVAYQRAMGRQQLDRDLAREYQERLSEKPDNAALAYLLARITTDPGTRRELLEHAVNGQPVNAYAYGALAAEHLANGRYEEGLPFAAKALELSPRKNEVFEEVHRCLLVGNKQYQLAIDSLSGESEAHFGRVAIRIPLRIAAGQEELAQEEIVNYVRELPAEIPQLADYVQNHLKSLLAYAQRDSVSYKTFFPELTAEESSFNSLLTLGAYDEAAKAIGELAGEESEETKKEMAMQHLLLYIAGKMTKKTEFAETHLTKAAALFEQTGHFGRILQQALTSNECDDVETLLSYPAFPAEKRIVMAALAQRFPQHAKEFASMARKLNFDLTFPKWFIENTLKPWTESLADTQAIR